MAIQQRKQTSIILTFKILQFVKQLRRRVQPRVLDGSIDASNLGNRIFPGVRRISKGWSRISIDAKQSRRVANRICKGRQKAPTSSRSSFRPGTVPPASRNLAGDEVEHTLSFIDNTLNPTGEIFSTIAGNSDLFLKHDDAPIYEGCSMHGTIQLLVAVLDAINVLSECRLQYGDEWLRAQGLAVGLSIDENFIANYEHMLLRLQTALVEALARKALGELLHGGHDKKQRKLLSWFTEFAEKPQPLSTSFPWTIKASLAVLWGVCWMFYGSRDSQPTGGGNDRVRLDRVLQNLDLQWDTGASSEYVNLGRELIGGDPQHDAHATNMGVGLDNDLFEARNTDTWKSDLTSESLTSRLPSVVVSHAAATGSRAEPLPHPNQDTYYSHIAQDFPPVSPANFYLPHNQGAAQPLPLTVFPNLGSDHQNPWHPYISSTLPPDNTRHLITSARDPRVRVTDAARSGYFAPPQTGFASSHIYHQVRQPEATPLYINTPYNFYHPDMMVSEMSSSTMHVPHKHERTTSINSNTDMPTPVSISGPRSPMMSPTAGPREQTHITSPRSHTHTHSRGISVDSMLSQDSNDDGSLRKNHSYKRAEEPPRNQGGKMVCKYQECHGLVFDRKCEWSKHMDKHDRPYRCTVSGCEKLQGFTYSGGLLRHEREVHKMHGGTKKSLFCPFHDCKRSSGAGFTRKENLAEHVRRVHRRTSMSADMHGLIMRRDTTMERSPLPESRIMSASESPFSQTMEYREEEDMGLKRKRGGSDSGFRFPEGGNEEMRSEIKRLRMENKEKDERLRQLEQAVMALQQQTRR